MADEIQPGPLAPAGSVVRPIYSVRNMKCYLVTESELRQIGLANLAMTASVGIASALVAFGIDIFKQSLMAGLPQETADVWNALKWFSLIFGVVFYLVALAAWFWRKGMLGMIQKESQDAGTPASGPPEQPGETAVQT